MTTEFNVWHMKEESRGSDETIQERKYVTSDNRYYEIWLSDKDDADEETVKSYPGLPAMGDQHPSNFRCRVISRKVNSLQAGQDGRPWGCSVTWSTLSPTLAQQTQYPWDLPPKIKFTTNKRDEALIKDLDDKWVVNGAKQPFATPVMVKRSDLVMTIELNLQNFDVSAARSLIDYVNQYTWKGAPPETLRIDDLQAESMFQDDYEYWKVIWFVAEDQKGWQPKPLNMGMMEIDTGGKLKRCRDDKGEDVSEPVHLTSDGKRIVTANLPADVNSIEYKGYPKLSFDTVFA